MNTMHGNDQATCNDAAVNLDHTIDLFGGITVFVVELAKFIVREVGDLLVALDSLMAFTYSP